MTPSGSFTMFPTTENAGVNDIAVANDGNVWFAEVEHKVGYVTPAGQVTEFDIPAYWPIWSWNITAGPGGTVWFIASQLYGGNYGNRTAMTDATGTSSYTYNSADRLTAVTNGAGDTISYSYNADGNITGLTYPGSNTVTRTYDDAQRLIAVAGSGQMERLPSARAPNSIRPVHLATISPCASRPATADGHRLSRGYPLRCVRSNSG
jgi:YD repeat-containing protein